MIRKLILALYIAMALVAIHGSANAQWARGIVGSRAWGDAYARGQADVYPWHGNYYYLQTGQPTALVVPPNVTAQTNYAWGVSQNIMTPVYSQFRPLPPTGAGGGLFRATPIWPSNTNQFGVYPVRGPW